jgi:hypothetical protein
MIADLTIVDQVGQGRRKRRVLADQSIALDHRSARKRPRTQHPRRIHCRQMT